MGKTMARLNNGVVTNLIWCSDTRREADALKNLNGYPVLIGDTYANGRYDRKGEPLLTPLERMQEEYDSLTAEFDGYVVDHEYRLTLLELGV